MRPMNYCRQHGVNNCPECDKAAADSGSLLNDLLKPMAGPCFVDSFNLLAGEINQNAIDHGWWKGERNEGEIIALIHSELSEALEALRHGNPPDNHIPDFTGAEAELADVVIRIMDVAAAKGWRVAEAIIAKINYNKTRPYLHGGKRF